MGENGNASNPLTQTEIWDDSALIRSWDEAVEEYKLYHSIQARGENVEDVLREAEEAGHVEDQGQTDELLGEPEPEPETEHDGGDKYGDEDDEDDDNDHSSTMRTHDSSGVEPPSEVGGPLQDAEPVVGPSTDEGGFGHVPKTIPSSTGPTAPLPQAVFTQGQDEGLKNLIIAWYFSGYYTGLHEGQQAARKANANTNGNV